ncbi:helix-turn-helix domain-containing protein [Oscillatoria laete-virens NRMC-F 0139]|nr:helix-turn-helix domain-containing protein [Oscillatoria laete-virens]MDL5054157.1 helix-turn-helix domain-containing protein [Oscillatoria laete-virens NRMC-F 0139]
MNKPRTLTRRELALLMGYCQCELGLTPQAFYAKWNVSYEQIAEICDRSVSTVKRWFARGQRYRRPTPNDLRHLALMDLLWDRWEELPEELKQQWNCIKS